VSKKSSDGEHGHQTRITEIPTLIERAKPVRGCVIKSRTLYNNCDRLRTMQSIRIYKHVDTKYYSDRQRAFSKFNYRNSRTRYRRVSSERLSLLARANRGRRDYRRTVVTVIRKGFNDFTRVIYDNLGTQ